MTVEKRSSEATITYKITSLSEGDEFNIPYQFLEDNDYLKVAIRNQDDEFIALTLNSDYEIELSDGTNSVYGIVRILKAFNDLENICIYRNIDISQEKIFDSQTIFSNTVESAFDKLTMILQDLLSINRAIHAPIDDIVDDDTLRLPPASERANGALYFDDMGNIKIGDFDAATKSLRQPEGEIADSTFEISAQQRSNGILAFNEKGNVKFLAIYSGGDGIEIAPNGRISVTDTFYTDPSTWTQGKLPESGEWKCICYGNGIFVAVAGSTNKVVYSDTGIVWQSAELPETDEWQTICFGKGVFVAIADNGVVAYSRTGTTWYESRLPTVDTSWKSVCYGNGVFIAVGHGNMGAYSNDGIDWEEIQIKEESQNWEKIAYGNGRFIVLDKNGVLAHSVDGINWTYSTLPVELQCSAITYGNGTFVVIAEDSDICLYGNDGTHWKYGTMPVDQMWTALAYGNGIFLAISADSDIAAFSRDGSEWTLITLDIENFLGGVISYGHYRFVAIEKSGDTTAYNASMPVQDKIEELSKPATTTKLGRVIIGDNLAITDEGRLSSPIATETQPGSVKIGRGLVNDEEDGLRILAGNGLRFNSDEIPKLVVNAGAGITVSAGVSIRAGNGLQFDINGDLVVRIADGLEFTGSGVQAIAVKPATETDIGGVKVGSGLEIDTEGTLSTSDFKLINSTLPSSISWKSVCYGNNTFVAIASNSNIVAYSSDGVYWQSASLPQSARYESICYGNGKFVLTSSILYQADKLVFLYSSDGINWYIADTSYISRKRWRQVCFGNGTFIAVSYKDSQTAYSYDGITWRQNSFPNGAYSVLCYGDGKFVTIDSDSSKGLCSTDGMNWTEFNLPSSKRWGSICYGNGKFVIVSKGSEENKAVYSTDCINWKEIDLPTTNYVFDSYICHGNGKFIIIFNNTKNKALYSLDGIHWEEFTVPQFMTTSMCYGKGKFIAISNSSDKILVINALYPPASKTTLGAVIVGDTLKINEDGKLDVVRMSSYRPSITVDYDNIEEDGEIYIDLNIGQGLAEKFNGGSEKYEIVLQPATTTTLGGVKIGAYLSIKSDGTLSSAAISGYNSLLVSYLFDENRFQLQISIPQLISDGLLHDAENDRIKLKPATTTTLGGIVVGDNLSVDENGKLNASAGMPPVGQGLSAVDGTLKIYLDNFEHPNETGLKFGDYNDLRLKIASTGTLGGVKLKASGGIIINTAGEIYINTGENVNLDATGHLNVPYASAVTAGVVKIGYYLDIDDNGLLTISVPLLFNAIYPVGAVVFFTTKEAFPNYFGTWSSEFVSALNVWKFTRTA